MKRVHFARRHPSAELGEVHLDSSRSRGSRGSRSSRSSTRDSRRTLFRDSLRNTGLLRTSCNHDSYSGIGHEGRIGGDRDGSGVQVHSGSGFCVLGEEGSNGDRALATG